MVQSVGIALDSLSRIVQKHFIYTSVLLDLNATSVNTARTFSARTRRYGILVEVYGGELLAKDKIRELEGLAVSLGGEQRPARLSLVEDVPAARVAERALSKCRGCCYWHIVSPILLCGYTMGELGEALANPRGLLSEILEHILDGGGLRPCEAQAEGQRLTLSALGLGFNLCKGEKRRYCRAILPGVGLYLRHTSSTWSNAYKRGFGDYPELGWGTLLPLPAPPEGECSGH